jgi:hypothetical protein
MRQAGAMAISLPLPVRVAAGLVVTGWDTLLNLPSELPALSVSVAGYAVRVSMRVQQEITQLAARGDELLSVLTSRPSEHPAWAHFDEEDEQSPLTTATDHPGMEPQPPVGLARFDDDELDVDVAWVATGGEVFNDDVEILAEAEEWLELAAADLDGLTEIGEPPDAVEPPDFRGHADSSEAVDPVEAVDSERRQAATDQDGQIGYPQLRLAPTSSDAWQRAESEPTAPHLSVVPDDAPDEAPGGSEGDPSAVAAGDETPSDAVTGSPPDAGTATPREAGGDSPAALPGYDRMTLAQVRGRLRGLSPGSVADLLSYEQAGAARAPFLTLLTNRMSTLEHEAR